MTEDLARGNARRDHTGERRPRQPRLLACLAAISESLSGKPAFYGDQEWPSLGGDRPLGAGTIPALERWTAGKPVPQP